MLASTLEARQEGYLKAQFSLTYSFSVASTQCVAHGSWDTLPFNTIHLASVQLLSSGLTQKAHRLTLFTND